LSSPHPPITQRHPPLNPPSSTSTPHPHPPTKQPIKLTIYSDPSRPLTYASTYGSGDLILGPGAVTSASSFLVVTGGSGGGRVVAMGVDVDALRVNSAG